MAGVQVRPQPLDKTITLCQSDVDVGGRQTSQAVRGGCGGLGECLPRPRQEGSELGIVELSGPGVDEVEVRPDPFPQVASVRGRRNTKAYFSGDLLADPRLQGEGCPVVLAHRVLILQGGDLPEAAGPVALASQVLGVRADVVPTEQSFASGGNVRCV